MMDYLVCRSTGATSEACLWPRSMLDLVACPRGTWGSSAGETAVCLETSQHVLNDAACRRRQSSGCRDHLTAPHLTPYQPSAQRSGDDPEQSGNQLAERPAELELAQHGVSQHGEAASTIDASAAAEGKPSPSSGSDASAMAEEARRLAASLREDAEDVTLLGTAAGDSMHMDDNRQVGTVQ